MVISNDFAMLDLPEMLSEKVRWLEDQIVSPNFAIFLSQLDVIVLAGSKLKHSVQPRQSIQQILGENRDRFLSDGLNSLTDQQFQQLLLSPEALVALNEEVLIRGGEYWKNKINLELKKLKAVDVPSVSRDLKPTPAQGDSSSPTVNLTTILGIAASVLLVICGVWMLGGFGGGKSNPQVAQGWGWERDDWFAEAKTPEQYMDRMVEGAKAWSAKQVDTKDAYVNRLTQLMAGCQKMIDAEHPLLTPTQRDLLVAKCRKWKLKFEDQLAEANAGTTGFLTTKAKTDATIDAAIVALREILNA